MHTLTLYRRTDPSVPIDKRSLEDGDLAIGRDANAGWVIPDPTAQVSRLHCILAMADGRLTLKDLSSNGVYIGEARTRATPGEPVPLADTDRFTFGQFMIVVERDESAVPNTQVGSAPSIVKPALFNLDAISIPSDWTAICTTNVAPPEPEKPVDLPVAEPSAAFKAFCAGAKLDPRDFAGEDEADVMRRVGAIYQATVIGLSSLMNERQSAKKDYGIDQTKIGARENNPFKFSATSRLGADVLKPHKRGFVTGPDAVRAAFVDVKKHLISMLAGSRAVLTATLDALNPDRIQERSNRESFFASRGAAAWQEYERAYAAFRMEVLTNPGGSVDAAFRAAYQRQLQELKEANELCTSQPHA